LREVPADLPAENDQFSYEALAKSQVKTEVIAMIVSDVRIGRGVP
jgi:hypothetical protein